MLRSPDASEATRSVWVRHRCHNSILQGALTNTLSRSHFERVLREHGGLSTHRSLHTEVACLLKTIQADPRQIISAEATRV